VEEGEEGERETPVMALAGVEVARLVDAIACVIL